MTDTTTDTTTEIATVLAYAGAMFDGGDEPSRLKITQEWVDNDFTADQVHFWTRAGCWDADTAAMLRGAGFRPDRDTLRVNDGDLPCRPDEMYALCNGDVTLDVLSW